jgi:hypothetical protein
MLYTEELMDIKGKGEQQKVNYKMDIPLTYEHYKNKQQQSDSQNQEK